MMLAYSLLIGSPTEIGLVGLVVGCVCGVAMLENWGDQGGLPGLGHLPCGEGSIEQHHKARRQQMSRCRIIWSGHKLSLAQEL